MPSGLGIEDLSELILLVIEKKILRFIAYRTFFLKRMKLEDP